MSGAGDPARAAVSCSFCGTTAAAPPPLTWVFEMGQRRGPVWICDRCARTHLRAIEAKLEQEWW
jgi:hypothetical protein